MNLTFVNFFNTTYIILNFFFLIMQPTFCLPLSISLSWFNVLGDLLTWPWRFHTCKSKGQEKGFHSWWKQFRSIPCISTRTFFIEQVYNVALDITVLAPVSTWCHLVCKFGLDMWLTHQYLFFVCVFHI